MKIKDCMTLTNVTQEKLSIRILSEYPNEEQMSFEEMKHHKWEHSLLSPSSVDFLKSMPYRIDTVCEGHSCLFCIIVWIATLYQLQTKSV